VSVRIEPSQISKFAAVYAEAVLTYLDAREAQWITWDGVSHRFDFISTEMDTPNMLILMTVDERWASHCGDVDELSDPEHPHFDPEALRGAIEHQLVEEGIGERILKTFLQRLDALQEAEAEEAEDRARDEEPDEQ
jgi:hypothetical protein